MNTASKQIITGAASSGDELELPETTPLVWRWAIN